MERRRMSKSPGKANDAKKKREAEERQLDEAIEESFPASDPIQSTGASAGAPDEHASEPPHKRRPAGKSG
jgi:hypothetical protein